MSESFNCKQELYVKNNLTYLRVFLDELIMIEFLSNINSRKPTNELIFTKRQWVKDSLGFTANLANCVCKCNLNVSCLELIEEK